MKLRIVLAGLALALAISALATVPSTATTAGPYTCNGSTTVFSVPFKFLDQSHLVVTKAFAGVAIPLIITTDYTVTGAGAAAGGNVTLVSGSRCASGYTLTVKRATPKTQPTSLRTIGTYQPGTVEQVADRGAMQVQELGRDKAELGGHVCGAGQVITSTDGVGLTCVNDNGSSPVADSSTVTAAGGSSPITLAQWMAQTINPISVGAKCDGATDDGPALAAVQTLAGSTKGIVVTCKLRIASAAGTVSAPIRFEGGGALDLRAGGSVTLSGPLHAMPQQILYKNGGTLSFNAKVMETVPQWWGAKCDGATDDAPALQAWFNDTSVSLLTTSNLHLLGCANAYLVTVPLTLPSNKFNLYGDGHGSYITGTVNGFILDAAQGMDALKTIRDLRVHNAHTTPITTGAIQFNNQLVGTIERVRPSGMVGIAMTANQFSTVIRDCAIRGVNQTHTDGGIGVLGAATLINNDIVGWMEGVRMWGSGASVTGGRMEVNRTAIRVGVDNTGATFALNRAFFGGIGMEANDIAIDVVSANDTVFAGIGHQGSTGSPSAGSIYGVKVGDGSPVFIGGGMNGAYSRAAAYVSGRPTFITYKVANDWTGSHVGATVWDVRVPPDHITVIGGSAAQLAGTAATWPDFLPSFAAQGIAALDMLNGTVAAKNVRGKDLTVGNGATSVAVTFPVTRTSGQAGFNGTGTPTTGGTLPNGTYYYCPALVNALGESSCVQGAAVTLSGGNNAVQWAFFGVSGTDDWRRRVYRGTATGVYDGYYDLPIRSSANWTDTGAAFTGVKGPSVTNAPSGAEADASYAVACTPQWDAKCWTTAKATTGFTLNFDPAPGTTTAVDWMLIR